MSMYVCVHIIIYIYVYIHVELAKLSGHHNAQEIASFARRTPLNHAIRTKTCGTELVASNPKH